MNKDKHKVERAIIMAAGYGKRMRPLSYSTPKPLIKVNGIRMIDSIIKALHENNINEIYIVIGYLKEKFYHLSKLYEGIHFIENPYYETWNNISSLYVAREYLENCMILDADQIIINPRVLSPYYEYSGYNSVWNNGRSDEWLQKVQGTKVIECSRIGGEMGWQLFSVSRWTREDGKRLKKHLELEFEKNCNKQIYWDDIPFFCYPEEYELHIWPMNKGDVLEIDDIKELALIDKEYQKFGE